MRVRCATKFDITATNVTGNHSRNRLPFNDATGRLISDAATWERSRNQQRNWETLQQILNLRTLLESLTDPVEDQKTWSFEFEVERPSSIELDNDPVGAIKSDCEGVPMILGLDESPGLDNYLSCDRNIVFEIINK